jgi:hypothetical protein
VPDGEDHSHSSSDFTDTISIRVKDKYFNVPRDLLIANSTFFDEVLSHSEPKKFFLVLDDIDADLFNTFVNMLFESYSSTTFKIRSRNDLSRGPPCRFLLRLWKLSHRFNSHRMCLLAEEALKIKHLAKRTPSNWETYYVNNTEANVRQQLLNMQECYTICKDESIPFEEEFVTACANCPGQVVAAHFDHLDPGFKAEVVRSFAIRVADPNVAQRKLVQRKREHEDESESKGLKKRRS